MTDYVLLFPPAYFGFVCLWKVEFLVSSQGK